MVLSRGCARQVFILGWFVLCLAIGGYIAVEDVGKHPLLNMMVGVLLVTEAVCVLFYGVAFRPERWRWAARMVPLIFVLPYVADWAYAGGLPSDKPWDSTRFMAVAVVFVMHVIVLYFLLRYGYAPKLPPDTFSVRVLSVALLGAGGLSFIRNVPVFTPRIRVTHNYLEEFNELSRPVPYDVNENAALDYARLADRIGAMPADVNRVRDLWPGDMDETGRRAVRAWVMLDPGAVDELIVAGRKTQYWIERYQSRGCLMDVELPGNSRLRALVSYLLLHAKLQACEDKPEVAVEEILTGYALGTQLAGPRTMIEQLIGMATCNFSMRSAFELLSEVHVEPTLLERFQDRLHELSSRWDHGFDCRAERLMALDWIQRSFSDDGAGGGCVSPRRSLRLGWGRVRIDRADTVSLLEDLVASLEVETRTTPWQCRVQGQNIVDTLERQKKPALFEFACSWSEAVTLSWRLRTRTAALLATLAIFRYRAETGHLPASLNDLVSAGYLNGIPLDPFGDGPLVYRQQDGDFVLYSRALDFDDDGGVPSYWGKGDKGGDQVFWPVDSLGGTNR